MQVKTGWYRTKNGTRAYVGAVAPDDAPLMMDDDYAVGWIITEDGWCITRWTRDGYSIGPDGDEDGDSLYSTEALVIAPPHETN